MAERHFNFTKASIAALPIPEDSSQRILYSDTRCPGLAVQVSSRGVITFFFNKMINRRPIRKKLGEFPHMSVDAARVAVAKILGEAEEHGRHAIEKYLRTEPNLNAGFEKYKESHLTKKGQKSVDAAVQQFNLYWRSDFGQYKLNDIRIEDVERHHRHLAEKHGKYSANRAVQLLKTIYNKLILWREHEGYNPAAGITLFKEEKRQRVLSRLEIERLLNTLNDSENEEIRDFVFLLMFIGCRKSTLLGMRWSEINFDDMTFRSPSEREKNGDAKIYALTEREIAILRRRQKGNKTHFVFPSDGAKSGRISAAGHRVDLKKSWAKVKKDAGIKNIRMHDLRRTLASWMLRSGSDSKTVQSAMNHRDHRTTLEVYLHTTSELEREARRKAHDLMLKEQ